MKITRENYELIFVDYLDGSLSDQEEGVLFQFLNNNPDLALELEGLNSIALDPPKHEFSGKKNLIKPLKPEIEGIGHFDYLCIADLEGDITEEERKELELYYDTNPLNRNTRNTYSKLKLIPDKKISYKGKNSLLRARIFNLRLTTFKSIGGIAASLGLLLGLFSLLNNLSLKESVQTAQSIEIPMDSNILLSKAKIKYKERPLEEPTKENSFTRKSKVTRERENESLNEINPINTSNDFAEDQEQEKLEIISPIQAAPIKVEMYAKSTFPIQTYNKNPDSQQVIPTNEVNNGASSRSIGVFDLAQMGINRLAKATGGSFRLEADKNMDGKIKKIHFETDLFALSMPINKKQK